jgi:hypothetical protein
LINLSELVARELESEIVLAKQQYALQQQEAAAAAAVVVPLGGGLLASQQQQQKQQREQQQHQQQGQQGQQQALERYQLLLRSMDCVTRCVWRGGGTVLGGVFCWERGCVFCVFLGERGLF